MIILTRDIDNLQRSTRREVERSAVNTLLQEYLGHEVSIAHHEDGMPYLPNLPLLHLSISHSLGRVAIALSDAPIGIDLERCSERIPHVIKRILPEEAQAYLETYPESDRSRLAHIFWTSAEALYKLVRASRVISDFHYDLSSILYKSTEQSFSLRARYKDAPEVALTLQGHFEGDYILTIARSATVL